LFQIRRGPRTIARTSGPSPAVPIAGPLWHDTARSYDSWGAFVKRREFLALIGGVAGRMAICCASPLIEEHWDTGFELSVTRSHDGG